MARFHVTATLIGDFEAWSAGDALPDVVCLGNPEMIDDDSWTEDFEIEAASESDAVALFERSLGGTGVSLMPSYDRRARGRSLSASGDVIDLVALDAAREDTTMGHVMVTTVERSTLVETAGAVDARVEIAGESYGVTLVPAEYDGTLSAWGERAHWLSDGSRGTRSYDLSRETLDQIESAVRAAAEAAGLAGVDERDVDVGSYVETIGLSDEDSDAG